MSLTRDQICTADDVSVIAVEVPEWKGTTYVRVMDGPSRDAFEEACASDRKRIGKKRGIRSILAAHVLCDENGGLLFDGEVDAIGRKSAVALDRVFAAAARINRLFKADIDELEKNSAPGPTEPSGSD